MIYEFRNLFVLLYIEKSIIMNRYIFKKIKFITLVTLLLHNTVLQYYFFIVNLHLPSNFLIILAGIKLHH